MITSRKWKEIRADCSARWSEVAMAEEKRQEILLLKLGEVVLKGLNRNVFEDKLVANVGRHVRPFGRFQVYTKQSTIYVEPRSPECDLDGAYRACLQVFGAVAVDSVR